MMTSLFNAIALVALIGTAFLVPPPPSASAPLAPRPTTVQAVPASVSSARAGSDDLQRRQPPVPVVRRAPAPPAIVIPDEAPRSDTKAAPDGLDKMAAKTAVEADGYKGVSIVGKSANGAWRAKAYRGTTEVVVVVDSTGRVSSE